MDRKKDCLTARGATWRPGIGASCVLFALTGCGGGGSTPTPTPSYTVGGNISSLTAKGLVLANGNDTVAVTSQSSVSTPFTLPTPVPTGSGYSVSIQTQPTGQTCIVANGAGTMGSANVTSVQVTCGNTVGGTLYNLTGSGLVLANGTDTVAPAAGATSFTFSQLIAYGATYSVSVQAQPASEMCGVAGGNGSILSVQNVADIQVPCAQANASSGSWVLQATSKGAAVYGTQGVPAPDNMPGVRIGAVTWVDASGNFWLFGGFVYSTALVSGQGNLNDLWKYDPGSRQWTWMSGAATVNAAGVYGTQGTAVSANVPGARQAAVPWTDGSGNLWLFGGLGYDSAGTTASILNDLWRYGPATGQWTWMSGATTGNATGVYGTQGVATSTNVPGARDVPVSWTDGSGNFWLFGGIGNDTTTIDSPLNDLWKYTPNTGQWTWMSGSSAARQAGVYGTQGVAAAGNAPGSRMSATSWIDSSGNLWLFGGSGQDARTPSTIFTSGPLNDLWKYSPGTGLWTWMSGSTADNSVGTYGTQGVAASGNVPGARSSAASWVDRSGNLWLFGGAGVDSTPPVVIKDGILGYTSLNDVWEYSPGTGQWTWVNGFTIGHTTAVYGSQGIGATGMPGALSGEIGEMFWTDGAGHQWLLGNDVPGSTTVDFWEFVQ
jgi:N-acetylneuraminic acid mutarotase